MCRVGRPCWRRLENRPREQESHDRDGVWTWNASSVCRLLSHFPLHPASARAYFFNLTQFSALRQLAISTSPRQLVQLHLQLLQNDSRYLLCRQLIQARHAQIVPNQRPATAATPARKATGPSTRRHAPAPRSRTASSFVRSLQMVEQPMPIISSHFPFESTENGLMK